VKMGCLVTVKQMWIVEVSVVILASKEKDAI